MSLDKLYVRVYNNFNNNILLPFVSANNFNNNILLSFVSAILNAYGCIFCATMLYSLNTNGLPPQQCQDPESELHYLSKSVVYLEWFLHCTCAENLNKWCWTAPATLSPSLWLSREVRCQGHFPPLCLYSWKFLHPTHQVGDQDGGFMVMWSQIGKKRYFTGENVTLQY